MKSPSILSISFALIRLPSLSCLELGFYTPPYAVTLPVTRKFTRCVELDKS